MRNNFLIVLHVITGLTVEEMSAAAVVSHFSREVSLNILFQPFTKYFIATTNCSRYRYFFAPIPSDHMHWIV